MKTEYILFAEFLGYEWNLIEEVLTKDKFVIQKSIPEFDTNWSWLMLVVREIETNLDNMNYERIDAGEELTVESFFDLYIEGFEYSSELGMMVSTDIDAVYKGCLMAIEWYNRNKD
jgi:hypothetical protein